MLFRVKMYVAFSLRKGGKGRFDSVYNLYFPTIITATFEDDDEVWLWDDLGITVVVEVDAVYADVESGDWEFEEAPVELEDEVED